MDMNQVMQLANNPQVRQLIHGLIDQFARGEGSSADLQPLVNQVQQAGMGTQLQSWLGNGTNEPITSRQVEDALGTSALDQAAAYAGMTPEKAASDLAKIMPPVIDQASPSGRLDLNVMQEILIKLASGQPQVR